MALNYLLVDTTFLYNYKITQYHDLSLTVYFEPLRKDVRIGLDWLYHRFSSVFLVLAYITENLLLILDLSRQYLFHLLEWLILFSLDSCLVFAVPPIVITTYRVASHQPFQ